MVSFDKGIIEVIMTTPPPDTVSLGKTYAVEGTVKLAAVIGAPPFVYLRVQRKEWWQPAALEQTSFLRGFASPAGGNVSINWTPSEAGKYNVALVATPAPISLPLIGVPPIMGESEIVNVTAGVEDPELTNLGITSYALVGGS